MANSNRLWPELVSDVEGARALLGELLFVFGSASAEPLGGPFPAPPAEAVASPEAYRRWLASPEVAGWDKRRLAAHRKKIGRASEGLDLPSDDRELHGDFLRELAEARPVLEAIAPKWRRLSGRPVLPPADYARLWREVIETWNKAVTARWSLLSPLCEACGRQVALRGMERLRGGDVRLSVSCSDRCRRRAAGRRAAARRRTKGRAS
jgi:hypothetical protein